ncbi:MAG: T9SS type A sorting domain-containing protein [Flavobacteriales bacterium]|nr:T9SS type A sorting domain-containing protein [Flavobacteriales bacterium]
MDFLTDRVVRWTFANILLVDSTTNEPLSHGRTSFRIHLLEPVAPGVEVANAADIFFDFNLPIRTPDAVVFTETSTGLSTVPTSALRLVPNPAQDRFTVVGSAQLVYARILGTDGRVVLERSLSVGNPTISIGALVPGSYVVEVREADGSTRMLRLVKQ